MLTCGVASSGTNRGTWNGRYYHTFYGGGISVIIEGFSPQEYGVNKSDKKIDIHTKALSGSIYAVSSRNPGIYIPPHKNALSLLVCGAYMWKYGKSITR